MSPSARVYMAVPFADKDVAKAFGARWEPNRRKWWFTNAAIMENPRLRVWHPLEQTEHYLAERIAEIWASGQKLGESPIWSTEAGSEVLAHAALTMAKAKKSAVTHKEPGHG